MGGGGGWLLLTLWHFSVVTGVSWQTRCIIHCDEARSSIIRRSDLIRSASAFWRYTLTCQGDIEIPARRSREGTLKGEMKDAQLASWIPIENWDRFRMLRKMSPQSHQIWSRWMKWKAGLRRGVGWGGGGTAARVWAPLSTVKKSIEM